MDWIIDNFCTDKEIRYEDCKECRISDYYSVNGLLLKHTDVYMQLIKITDDGQAVYELKNEKNQRWWRFVCPLEQWQVRRYKDAIL